MREWIFTIISAWDQKWPVATGVLAVGSFLDFLFKRIAPQSLDNIIPRGCDLVPWYWWVIIWLLFLSLMMVDYATKQRLKAKELPKTKFENFMMFLDKKISDGEKLCHDKKLSKISIVDWYTKLLGGIALAICNNFNNSTIDDYLYSMDQTIDAIRGYDEPTPHDHFETPFNHCIGFLKGMRKAYHPNDIKEYEFSDLKGFE
jgi:hypothetical protein